MYRAFDEPNERRNVIKPSFLLTWMNDSVAPSPAKNLHWGIPEKDERLKIKIKGGCSEFRVIRRNARKRRYQLF